MDSNTNNTAQQSNKKFAMAAGVGVAALAAGALALWNTYSKFRHSYSENTQSCKTDLEKIREDLEEYPVLGIDCQWTPTFDGNRSRIALLQLATHKGNILLIALKKLTPIPYELREILQDRSIIKTGIEVLKDAAYLHEDYGLVVNSTYDLRFLAENTGNVPHGLQALSKSILGLDLGRDWEVVNSNWNAEPLEDNQRIYAEKAVKASIDIFKKLVLQSHYGNLKQTIGIICKPKLDEAYVYRSERWD